MINLKKVLVSTVVLVVLLVLSTAAVYAETSNKVGTITGSVVNLREEPNTSSTVLDQLEKGTQVKVVSSKDNWYKVNYNGITGWISADYITVKEVTLGVGTVNVDVLNVRTKPSTDADVVAKLNKGDKVTVLSASDNWYKIRMDDKTEGYVFGDYITLNKDSKTSRGDDGNRSTDENTSLGQKIAQFAKKFVGTGYVWGGTTPDGFDCSGLVVYVFKNFGIDLERVAGDQARQGTAVKRADLRAGDLVFFDTSGRDNGEITHVGIYIGGGKFIHAANPDKGVTITSMDDDYYSSRYVKARRIVD